jgi:putative FmdB family regulatory protein
MPTYDYTCAACGRRFEVVHGVHGHGPETCPSCGGGPVRKAFAPPTVVFKGSGWAKVDRRSSSTGAKRDSGDEGSKAEPSKSEPSKSEPAAPGSTGGEGGTAPATKKTD